MNSYFNLFKKKNCGNSFFIGENTGEGFVSHVGDFFSEDELSGLYIIKGGPGTGKSTLMKKAASAAAARGFDVTYLYCSSDPDSLDGITVTGEGGKIGILDGTAPHATDPEYPGAGATVVDLYPCFNTAALIAQKGEIARLCRRKKESFNVAYGYLCAAGKIASARQRLVEKSFLYEKAAKLASRIASGITETDASARKQKNGAVIPRQTFALSCKGAVRLSGFDGAVRKILLCDHACALPLFLQVLTGELVRRGEKVFASVSPVFGLGEIYVPSASLVFSPFVPEERCERVINISRFTEKESLSQVRGRLNFSGKCVEMAVNEALENLREAGKAHGELEKIYTPAVDFSKVDEITNKLIADAVLSIGRRTSR